MFNVAELWTICDSGKLKAFFHLSTLDLNGWVNHFKPLCAESYALDHTQSPTKYVYIPFICFAKYVAVNVIASWITLASDAFLKSDIPILHKNCSEEIAVGSLVCKTQDTRDEGLHPSSLLLQGLSYCNRLDIGKRQILGIRGYIRYIAATWHFFQLNFLFLLLK